MSETAALQKFTPDSTADVTANDVECWIGTSEDANCLPLPMVTLPRHSHPAVSAILEQTERTLQTIHRESKAVVEHQQIQAARDKGKDRERIYANNYVDLGKIDTCVATGFVSISYFFVDSLVR